MKSRVNILLATGIEAPRYLYDLKNLTISSCTREGVMKKVWIARLQIEVAAKCTWAFSLAVTDFPAKILPLAKSYSNNSIL